MSWVRGEKSLEIEVANMQSWIENTDVDLHGRNGDDGVIREWRDFKAGLKVVFILGGVICGLPGLLLTLSALGIIHLK